MSLVEPTPASATDRPAPRLSLDALLAAVPNVHRGRSVTWGIDERLARFLDAHLRPHHVTLETGSGLSTLVMLRAGVARHVAVAPDADEFAVIRTFAECHALPTGSFTPVVGCSQDVLPRLDLPPLDVVLIDGDHAFPTPFVDWQYTADRLVVGGMMIVDDIHILTGAILADFMAADPKWELVLRQPERFAIFRKLRHPISDGAWMAQPYLLDCYPVAGVRVARASPPVRDRLRRVYAGLPPTLQAVCRAGWRAGRIALGRERRHLTPDTQR